MSYLSLSLSLSLSFTEHVIEKHIIISKDKS